MKSDINTTCDGCGHFIKNYVMWPHGDGFYCRDCILKVINHDKRIDKK